ncbi:MAG: 2',3'-cyclic-nucleotide 2'-phosphodiesterase [Melioribacteraceae bacterium]|nr:MAG: 2',3'-cyclic-nucleotide 2'-phosphodiesterase [Melioribacteraceae bacterium]
MRFVLSIFLMLTTFFYAQNVQLTILETSDVHGKIFPYDFVEGTKTGHSLASVKYYVDSLRTVNPEGTLLLDNGDILQGSPAVYYYNYIDTSSSHLYADVINYIGYDAGTVGNHDIEAGHPVYDKFAKTLNFPWLAANAINTKTGKPYFQPYHIIERSGVKIAVLGLITPGIPNWLPPSIWSGIEFIDMVRSAEEWIPVIKKKENPDIIIGLFHSGVEYTYGGTTRETKRNENASLIVAEDVPGFDIVFVGHDHHGWNEYVTDTNGDSVLIIGPTSSARDIAKVDINFNTETRDFNISSRIVNLGNAPESEEYLTNFNPQFEAIKKFVDKPIGKLTADICSGDAVIANAAFTDLIHKIQLEISGADISFAAPLSMNTCLEAGEIKVAHLFDLYKYENLLYTMRLSGREIKEFLEYSTSLRYTNIASEHILKLRLEDGKAILNSRGKASPANSFYNFDDAEGINYSVDLSKPEGSRVTISEFSDGTEFYSDSLYKVAINSYRGSGGGGHLTKGSGIPREELNSRILFSTSADLRYYMINYIEQRKIIKPLETQNWKLLPEAEAREKLQKDKLLLLGSE